MPSQSETFDFRCVKRSFSRRIVAFETGVVLFLN